MRPGVRNGLVAAWVVLAAGGWGAAQWLGEPAATGGPAPAARPSSGAEPGPQPEFSCDDLRAAAAGPRAVPGPSPDPSSPSATAHLQKFSGMVLCDSARFESGD
ncbi:hypothetical protein ACFVWY_03305 [Streptomyces sp. NPDC058195]|uniref:hypothetical protein n=1 Tax=Streptomyces sp. NPDC058195 TaxID=3346375 RepID=UPI0036E1BA76